MKELVIICGSKSDQEIVDHGIKLCQEYDIDFEQRTLSAHRNVKELDQYLEEVEANGKTEVIIAAAGLSAALPGAVAARVKIPVLGVPLAGGVLNGVDAAYAILQMPGGVPVATMGAIGKPGMLNAVHMAKRILDRVKRKR
ncbi:MAG: AIR carboxylase family protein [Rickettsiales bacterium]|jgi:5-(carboxyamino)imidazole ribonucleotide mutase|nr:AIR carboxylase family protein [Rickettsiales bacterium]